MLTLSGPIKFNDRRFHWGIGTSHRPGLFAWGSRDGEAGQSMKGVSLNIFLAWAAVAVFAPAWADDAAGERDRPTAPVASMRVPVVGDIDVGAATTPGSKMNPLWLGRPDGVGGAPDSDCTLSPATVALGLTCFVLDPTDDDFVKENVVFVESEVFGRLQFGRQNGAGREMSFSAPNVLVDFGSADRVFGMTDDKLVGSRNMQKFGYDDFAFKVMYATPRVMGAQLAVSFAPETQTCGAVFCPTTGGALFADSGNLFEVGGNYYRTFGARVAVGVSGAYQSSDSAEVMAALPALQDYESWNVGANVTFSGFTVGASYKQSYLGRDAIDFNAYDVGASYEKGSWGFMISYGADSSGLTGEESRAIQGGIDYSLTNRLPMGADVQVGAGVQYSEGDSVLTLTPNLGGAPLSKTNDDSMAVFLETLVSF